MLFSRVVGRVVSSMKMSVCEFLGSVEGLGGGGSDMVVRGRPLNSNATQRAGKEGGDQVRKMRVARNSWKIGASRCGWRAVAGGPF